MHPTTLPLRTLLRLVAVLAVVGSSGSKASASDIQLQPVGGSNPGALEMYQYLPAGLSPGSPLVVLLHGCSQSADDYVSLSGWQELADAHQFALLAPQQVSENNLSLCFNWYEDGDITRDAGEALSIKTMIDQVMAAEELDGTRIFVTGLSAGGFMSSAMLAIYPELFAAGAVIAGGPYRCADSLSSALGCMNGEVSKEGSAWAELVSSASSFAGSVPRLSIWHGDADTTVSPHNAGELLKQWLELHGLATAEPAADSLGEHQRLRYGAPALVESITLSGMGHALPVDPEVCGAVGAYASDVGVCSSLEIARFWGIVSDGDGGGGDGGGGEGGSETSSGGCSIFGDRAAGYPVPLLFILLLMWRRRIAS